MRLLLSTASVPHYGLERAMQLAKEAGCDGVEVAITELLDSQDADYLKHLIKRTGMPVLALRLSLDTTVPNITMSLALAKAVGAEVLVLRPPQLLNIAASQWLKYEYPKVKNNATCRVLFENSDEEGMFGFLPSRSLSNFADLAALGLFALDTSSVYAKKASVLKVWNSLKTNIGYVTLANFKKPNADHYLPTEGEIGLESLLERMAQGKYTGCISLLVRPQHLGESRRTLLVANLQEQVGFVRRFFPAEPVATPAAPAANAEPAAAEPAEAAAA